MHHNRAGQTVPDFANNAERLLWEEARADPCMDCGLPDLGWAAKESHWQRVMGDYNAGVLCPRCFSRRSHEKGIPCRWSAVDNDEGRP
jgi:hypothetical protein